MPSCVRCVGRYSVRNSHQFFVPETVHGRLTLAGSLATGAAHSSPVPLYRAAHVSPQPAVIRWL
jgi:hypothetical protein